MFFLFGSIVMYISVRNIVAEDLQNRLYQDKANFFSQLNNSSLQEFSSDFFLIEKYPKLVLDSFSDTVQIIDQKYVLYRKLQFSYFEDNQNYRISILKLQSQSDLLITKIVIMNVGFAMLFFLIVFFVNRQSIRNALKVFYSTIKKLEYFEINNNKHLELDVAEVEEIKKLNFVFEKMSNQIRKDFEVQKEYTENVAHELQTPLAIISSKADELMQSDNLKKEQMEQLALLLETTNRLSKINQSLIFLTKIDNRFYTKSSSILLNQLIKEQLVFFEAAIEEKSLELNLDIDHPTHIHMNPYLAETLVVNLLKNAIVHNNNKGELIINLIDNKLMIANSGNALTFHKSDIFKRFIRSEHDKKSLGIGLSIVQRICILYGFHISYEFHKNHIFTLNFSNK